MLKLNAKLDGTEFRFSLKSRKFGVDLQNKSINLLTIYYFDVYLLDGWLVGWVLWHINLFRLFNAKSIFMKTVPFQTIQFSISTQFKCKYCLIVQNISISAYSV